VPHASHITKQRVNRATPRASTAPSRGAWSRPGRYVVPRGTLPRRVQPRTIGAVVVRRRAGRSTAPRLARIARDRRGRASTAPARRTGRPGGVTRGSLSDPRVPRRQRVAESSVGVAPTSHRTYVRTQGREPSRCRVCRRRVAGMPRMRADLPCQPREMARALWVCGGSGSDELCDCRRHSSARDRVTAAFAGLRSSL
jgi:hypothetical protein